MSKIMTEFKAAVMLTRAIKKAMRHHWDQKSTTVRNVAILVARVEYLELVLNELKGERNGTGKQQEIKGNTEKR